MGSRSVREANRVPMAGNRTPCIVRLLLGTGWEWYRSEVGLVHAHAQVAGADHPLV